jgi:hypothetical protein
LDWGNWKLTGNQFLNQSPDTNSPINHPITDSSINHPITRLLDSPIQSSHALSRST